MSSRHTLVSLAGLALAAASGAANAATVTAHPTVPAGFPATHAVHFNGGGDVTSGFNFVTGHTNTGTTYLIDFTSNEAMQVNNAGSGGAASVLAGDGEFTTWIISHDTAGIGFTALELNIDGGAADGTIEFFKGSSYSGTTFVPGTAIASLTLDENGANKFYILAGLGEVLGNVGFRVTAPTYMVDIKQIAVASAAVVVPTPAAATAGLSLLAGLAAASAAHRRRT